MEDDWLGDAVDFAVTAMRCYHEGKDIADHIKKEFDKKHSPTWHCVVGPKFGR